MSRNRKKKILPDDFIDIDNFAIDGEDVFDYEFELEDEIFNNNAGENGESEDATILQDQDLSDTDDSSAQNDENSKTVHPKKKSKTMTEKLHSCSYCEKMYKTLSGRIRHEKTIHKDISKTSEGVKGPDTQVNSPGKDVPVPHISTLGIWNNLSETVITTLDQMLKNEHFAIRNSAFGSKIMLIAKLIIENTDTVHSLSAILKQRFESEFIKVSSVNSLLEGSVRENLFRGFDGIRCDYPFLSTLQAELENLDCLSDDSVLNYIMLFIPCFIRQISSELLKEVLASSRTTIGNECTSEETYEECLSDNDSKVLYLVAGYILFALKKKCIRHKNMKYQSAVKVLKSLVKRNNTLSKQYVKKHSDWLDRVNRGGLIQPADDFFLLVKEMEVILRKKINMKELVQDSLNKKVLTEYIVGSFMVHYYWDSLCIVEDHFVKLFVLELIIGLFLTVRSFAIIKNLKAQYEKETGSNRGEKSLRKALKNKQSENLCEL